MDLYYLVVLTSFGIVLYILFDLEKMSKRKGWGGGWIGWKRLAILVLILVPIFVIMGIIDLITKWFIGNELVFPVIATMIAVIWWIWLKTKYKD
jgi:hypothetical protein